MERIRLIMRFMGLMKNRLKAVQNVFYLYVHTRTGRNGHDDEDEDEDDDEDE